VWLILLAVLGAALVSLLALARWDSPARAIVGGTPVPNGRHLFMANLAIFKTPTSNLYEKCGGTLIDPDSVLTAAHCVVAAGDVWVRVGWANHASYDKEHAYTTSEAAIFIHPRYRHLRRSDVYDAAVIKLDRPIPADRSIKPIGLATAQQDELETPGNKLTVAGWGSTNEGGPQQSHQQSQMREVSVPVVADGTATRLYSEDGASQYFPSTMVAAGESGKGPCNGDSGGPLFDPATSTQVGIASFSRGCARRGLPGVYTEVNNPDIRTFILNAARR
jgi:secreted trypsin-like serine protease